MTVNGITINKCKNMLDLRSIDRLHDLEKGKARQVYESLCKAGLISEGVDYCLVTKEEYRNETGLSMSGRNDQKMVLVGKNAYDLIVKRLSKKRNINDVMVYTIMNDFFCENAEPVEVVSTDTDNDNLVLEVRRLSALVEQMLAKMDTITSVNNREIVVADTDVVSDTISFEDWSKNIDNALETVMKNHGITRRKIVLNKAYTMMRNQYGIVWEQERKEYYDANGEYPLSTFNLAYWIEQKNPSCKNLLYVCIMHFNEEGIVTHLTMPKKIIPSLEGIDNIDKVREIIDYIGKETKCESKNNASIWRSLKCYIDANSGVDLGMAEMTYRIDHKIYPNEKLTVFDYMFDSSDLTQLMPNLFKDWAQNKYSACFEQ